MSFTNDAAMKRTAGRPPNPTWGLFTETYGAHKMQSAVCKNCQQEIVYNKKREVVETHLNQCQPFLEVMRTLAPEVRPDWLGVKRVKRERKLGDPTMSLTDKQNAKQQKKLGKKQQAAVADALAVAAAYAAASNVYHDATLHAFPPTQQSQQQQQQHALHPASVDVDMHHALHAPSTLMTQSTPPMITSSSLAKQWSQTAKFHELLALHVLTTGASLASVSDAYLVQAVALLRPEAHVPTRLALTTTLLDMCYERAMEKTRSFLSASGTVTCVVATDSGFYCAVTPRKTLVVSAPPAHLTETHLVDAHLMENDILNSDAVAAQLATALSVASGSGGLVVGAVTRETPVYKHAWHLVNAQQPFRETFFYGCVSHALAALERDLFEPLAATDSINESPFAPALSDFAADCLDVVQFIASRFEWQTYLTTHQQRRNGNALPALVATPLQLRFTTLRKSAELLQQMVQEPHFVHAHLTHHETRSRQRIREIVEASTFIANVERALAILAPLDLVSKRFEATDAPTSDVIPAFYDLSTAFETLVQQQHVSALEGAYLTARTNARLQLLQRPAHTFAYVLDPRFLGDVLSPTQRRDVDAALVAFVSGTACSQSAHLSAEAHAATLELANYTDFARADRRSESPHFVMLIEGKRTPLQFWQLEGNEWPRLQRAALQVFALVASSAVASAKVQRVVDAVRHSQDEESADAAAEGSSDALNDVNLTADAFAKRVIVRANARESSGHDITGASSNHASGAANYYWESEDVAII